MQQSSSISTTVTTGLALRKIGNGQRLLFAFHGFDDDGTYFEGLDLRDTTIIAFDLPYHGMSAWNGQAFPIQELIAFIEEESKAYTSVDIFGHSFGANVVLAIVQQSSVDFGHIHFAAPYLQLFWYQSVMPIFPFKILGWLLRKESIRKALLKLAILLKKVKLINRSAVRFLQKNLKNTTQIERLLYYNTVLGQFPFKTSNFKKIQHLSSIQMYAAALDTVIPVKAIEKFAAHTRISSFKILKKERHRFQKKTLASLLETRTTLV